MLTDVLFDITKLSNVNVILKCPVKTLGMRASNPKGRAKRAQLHQRDAHTHPETTTKTKRLSA